MKIVWILVILIIIGVAVFAIRKRIGDEAGNKEKESDVKEAEVKDHTQQAILAGYAQTFQQKVEDVYSGKISSGQAFEMIRTDNALSEEDKAKMEFEAIMQEWWPNRAKFRANALQYSGKFPTEISKQLDNYSPEYSPSARSFDVQVEIEKPWLITKGVYKKGFVLKSIPSRFYQYPILSEPEDKFVKYRKTTNEIFPMYLGKDRFSGVLLGFYDIDALFDKNKFWSQNTRLKELQYKYPWVSKDIRVQAVLNSTNL